MADKSAIEWTEATLNPWTGCSKISPGCARCYISRTMPFRTAGRDFDSEGRIPLVFHMERLEKMIRRRKPTMYFVNSLSDLFHEDATDEQIQQVFDAMAMAQQHTFQVLTKRPERMRDLRLAWHAEHPECGPLPNVWLGVTIENRRFTYRADVLRDTPAAVRFVSAEPLLGPLVARFEPDGDLDEWVWPDGKLDIDAGYGLDLTDVDWLICGGESGQGARRFDLRWARDLRDACAASGTAYFMKQLGGYRPGSALEDLPEDLRIREMPKTKEAEALF